MIGSNPPNAFFFSLGSLIGPSEVEEMAFVGNNLEASAVEDFDEDFLVETLTLHKGIVLELSKSKGIDFLEG